MAKPLPDNERCESLTGKKGVRCKFKRKPESRFCGRHSDNSQYKKKQHREGRPTSCTPELTKRFADQMAAGNYVETACAFLGLSVNSFYTWRRAAKEAIERVDEGGAPFTPDEKCWVEFSYAIDHGRAQAETVSVMRVRKAGAGGNVNADMWFLERAFPDRWGRRKVEHKVDVDGSVTLTMNMPAPRVLNDADEHERHEDEDHDEF